MTMASVIIPAHDEAALLPGLLTQLGELPGLQIIVVCNGCTDDTATIARRFPGVRVLELTQSSKVAALNAGDAATDVFPRIYLDADVLIDGPSMRSVIDALTSGAQAAAPVPVIATGSSSWAIRRYYAVWSRLGYLRFHTLGSGVYGLSEQGRSRFGLFPELIADDAFVYCQFAADERVNPPGAVFTVRPPRTIRALTRRRVRIVAGNLELRAETGLSVDPPGPGWREVIRERPALLASLPVFLGVNLTGAVLARRRARLGTAGSWGQDTTIRQSRQGNSVHTHGLTGALRRALSMGSWRQLARRVNFISYDGIARDSIELGAGVRMSPTVSVRNGGRIRIGAGSHIGQGSCLWAGDHSGRIDIGDHALLAPNVFITASNYDFDAGPGPVMDLPKRESHVRIGANTWLGANVVVVPGVQIGDGTVVAAGAVVTHDLPPGCVAGGVPARVIRERGRDGTGAAETLDGSV